MYPGTRRLFTAVLLLGLVTVTGAAIPAASGATPEVTFVEEDVTADTTWTAAEGPYRVIRDITVDDGATLTIEPGTEIQFAERTSLTVAGSLSLNGTADRPISVGATPGASANTRWTTVRYAGDQDSALAVHNATIADARDGITVASREGRVSVRDTTVRDVSRHGLAIGDVATAPAITVEGSTFANIGGHGIAATPRSGSLAAIDITASTTDTDERATHTLTLEPGVETTGDELVLDYGRQGNVSGLGTANVERFGIDRDGDDELERTLSSRVTNLTTIGGTVRLTLSEPITIPGDAQLVLAISGVRNPNTRGVYPIDVGIAAAGVPQLADGVHAPLVVGDIFTEYAKTDVVEPTAVRSLSVRSTSFDGIGGDGVRVDADAIGGAHLSDNSFAGIDGTGITLRGRTADGVIGSNRIRGGDAGIHLAVAERLGPLAIVDNVVSDATTGLRVRQSASSVGLALRTTIVGNTVTGSERYGINVDTDRGRLYGVSLSENVLTDNDLGGASVSVDSVESVRIADNRVRNNGGDGMEFRMRRLAAVSVTGNELAVNTGDGLAMDAYTSIRGLSVRNVSTTDNGGHGLAIGTGLVAHNVTVTDGRFANNAGAGVIVTSPLTHGGRVAVTDSLVAANAYGVRIEGALQANVTGNAVVFNTNEHAEPVPIEGVEPGTGISISEGAAGVVLDRGAADPELTELVADPSVNAQLYYPLDDGGETAVVLRTDGTSHARLRERASLSIDAVLGDLPTGVAISTGGNAGVSIDDNDVYGHGRGLVVDVAPLIDANSTGRLLVTDLRTVTAEDTYWGDATGPFHDSILPTGGGDRVLTRTGWVDFVPYATAPHRERHARPVASLAAPETAVPDESVALDGGDSYAPNGSIARYHFTVDGAGERTTADPVHTVTMPADSLSAGLMVEDDLGVDSAERATVTVDANVTETTTTTGQPGTGSPTTGPNASGTGIGGTITGALGGLSYLIAMILGGYGMALTLQSRDPPYEGLVVHGFAVAAVAIWAVGGLLFGGTGLRLAVAGGGLWAVLTGVAYVLATR